MHLVQHPSKVCAIGHHRWGSQVHMGLGQAVDDISVVMALKFQEISSLLEGM